MSKVITIQLNMIDETTKFNRAKGYYKRIALAGDTTGAFKQLVAFNKEADNLKNLINQKYGPGTIKYGSEIPPPPARPEVIEMDLINDFMKRNPQADGGRIPFKYAGRVKFENIIEPKIYEGNRFSKKMPPGTFTMRLYEGLDENGNKIFNTYTGKKEKLKKIFDEKNRGRVKQVKSERAATASFDKPYKILQGENKGKYLINYGGGTESPKVTKYFDPKEYGSDKAAYDAANKELTDYKNRPDKYANLKGNFRKNVVQPEGFVTGQEMLEEARKKGINVSENRQASNFADNFGFPKKGSGPVVFYDISKLDDPKEVDKILKAQVKAGAGTDLAKEKFPIKTKSEIAQARYKNIVEKGGVRKGSPIAGKRILNVDMGHAGNIFSKNANELITLDKLTYTPSEINEILGQKGGVDDKIRAIEKSQKKIIEKFNDADAASYMDKNNIVYDKSKGNFKKQLLSKSDATLTRLVLDSGGYKTAQLSTGVDFGKSFLKNITDPFGLFKGMTERDFVDFRRQYITDEGNLKSSLLNDESKKLKINLANTEDFDDVLKYKMVKGKKVIDIPKKELKNLINLKMMEENRIKQLEAAGNVPDDEIRKIIQAIGCPNAKAGGGRIEFSTGGDCFDKGQKLINNKMKGASPAQLKNLSKLGPMLLKAGSAVMSGLIVPEALIVGLDAAARVGLGDTPAEAILRATDYITPDSYFGNFLQKADLMKIERTLGKDVKNIAAQSFARTDQSNKINKLEKKLKNLEAMSESSEFGYVGDLTNQINMTKDQIKKEKEDLKNKFTTTGQESRDIYTERAFEDAYDASMAKSKFAAKNLVDSQSENPRIRASQDMQDMISQKKLNEKKIDSPKMKPNLGAFVNFDDRQLELLAARTGQDLNRLRQIQDYLNQERKLSFAEQEKIFGKELTYGTQGHMGQPIEREGPGYYSNYNPSDRYKNFKLGMFSEGGITTLRSKYEYKK